MPAANQIAQLVWSSLVRLRVLRSFAWRTHRHAPKAIIKVPEIFWFVNIGPLLTFMPMELTASQHGKADLRHCGLIQNCQMTGERTKRPCVLATYVLLNRKIPATSDPDAASDGWFTPSCTTTSSKSNGLIPSRQETLIPNWFGLDRR